MFADFSQETPEFFDKTKAGEFTLKKTIKSCNCTIVAEKEANLIQKSFLSETVSVTFKNEFSDTFLK